MDPCATLERIRNGYRTNDHEEIADACADLLGWLHARGFTPMPTEPQLSALLIMATGYARRGQIEHAPGRYRLITPPATLTHGDRDE